jgi:hypothetical protein
VNQPIAIREEALARGTRSNVRRAEFKRELKAGTRRLSEVLRAEIPDWLGSMPAERLLRCAPRVGTSAASSLLQEARLGPRQEARYITTRQRNLLASELEKIENLKGKEAIRG